MFPAAAAAGHLTARAYAHGWTGNTQISYTNGFSSESKIDNCVKARWQSFVLDVVVKQLVLPLA